MKLFSTIFCTIPEHRQHRFTKENKKKKREKKADEFYNNNNDKRSIELKKKKKRTAEMNVQTANRLPSSPEREQKIEILKTLKQ